MTFADLLLCSQRQPAVVFCVSVTLFVPVLLFPVFLPAHAIGICYAPIIPPVVIGTTQQHQQQRYRITSTMFIISGTGIEDYCLHRRCGSVGITWFVNTAIFIIIDVIGDSILWALTTTTTLSTDCFIVVNHKRRTNDYDHVVNSK